MMVGAVEIRINNNCFTGMLPEGGLKEVTVHYCSFYLHHNRFTGALPDSGIWSLGWKAVYILSLFWNEFTGSLPENNAMFSKLMFTLYMHNNFFAGTAAERLPTHFPQNGQFQNHQKKL
eukprot:3588657-Amphidinium_carterae.1